MIDQISRMELENDKYIRDNKSLKYVMSEMDESYKYEMKLQE